jgi:signal transduction histidine kinase
MVVACTRAPRLNAPLAALVIATMLVIGTHFRMVARYYFQVTPFIVLFVTMLLVAAATEIVSVVRPRPKWFQRAAFGLALAPAMWLTTIHIWSIPSRIDSARRYNDSGAVQSGPTNPRVTPAFEIVEDNTRPDDIIVYYRARTMTLYTDRRTLQLSTSAIPTMTRTADYFMQNRRSDYSQPVATDSELEALGYEVVYDDPNWRLWRVPDD